MIICHIGTLPLQQMGYITRKIFYQCEGQHIYCQIGNKIPDADIYLLECFKAYNDYFYNFKSSKGKIISLLHSSYPCMPSLYSDIVITLTNYAQEYYKQNIKINSKVIYGGIELPKTKITDYNNYRFGRITRNAPEKFHPKWNQMIKSILNKNKKAELFMYVNKVNGLLKHKRIKYITDIKIDEHNKKIKTLSDLSLAVFAHGNFEEVFPLSILECMSIGLPVLTLYQPSMAEMIGHYQPIYDDISHLEKAILEILSNTKMKEYYGWYARKRAEYFSIDKMINAWNELFKEII